VKVRNPRRLVHAACVALVLGGASPAVHASGWNPTVISDVAEQVTPAVVSLTTTVEDADAEPGRGTGSGVIVRPDGLIVTSHHVVKGAEPIYATLSDGRRLRAQRVGGDPSTDVAVVRIEATDLPTVALGDATELRLGELVLAVGNPFDVGQTVTLGIVSATGRSSVGILDYEDFIQTDAAINPGNSGGALVNLRGELVGINTSIISRTGGAQGVGFAIPTHVVTWVQEQLVARGEVRHGWLGVRVQTLEPELAARLDVAVWTGVLVTDILGAPARKAGLAVDDVITHVDDRPVLDPDQLRSRIGLTSPGTTVALTVVRGERRLDVPVELGESGWVEPPPKASPRAAGPPGLELRRPSAEFRRKWALPRDLEGWVVTEIEPGSPAGRSALERHDVVLSVDGRPLASESKAIQEGLRERGHAVLRVHRRGTELFVVLRP